ncbi:MAG: hypothetical protein V1816_02885 [Pseudomonadota bacterium]
MKTSLEIPPGRAPVRPDLARRGALILAVALSLVMLVGLLETPFVASRLAPRAFWETYCRRAGKRVVGAGNDLKIWDEIIAKARAAKSEKPGEDERLAKLEAARHLLFEHKKMMEEKWRQLESERDKFLARSRARDGSARVGVNRL